MEHGWNTEQAAPVGSRDCLSGSADCTSTSAASQFRFARLVSCRNRGGDRLRRVTVVAWVDSSQAPVAQHVSVRDGGAAVGGVRRVVSANHRWRPAEKVDRADDVQMGPARQPIAMKSFGLYANAHS